MIKTQQPKLRNEENTNPPVKKWCNHNKPSQETKKIHKPKLRNEENKKASEKIMKEFSRHTCLLKPLKFRVFCSDKKAEVSYKWWEYNYVICTKTYT